MSNADDQVAEAPNPLIEDTGDAPEAGHDAWVREQLEAVAEAKRADRMTTKPLREVAAKFGFHAR